MIANRAPFASDLVGAAFIGYLVALVPWRSRTRLPA
jgi:hypothetical protein